MPRLTLRRKIMIILTTPLWMLWGLWLCFCMFLPFGIDKMDFTSPWVWTLWAAWLATLIGFVAKDRIDDAKSRVRYLGK